MDKFLKTTGVQFVIPVYQRNYDWKEEQCRQLWNDIIETGNSSEDTANHFIGSIVYIDNGIYTTGGTEQLVIIDGQQRITTVTLLLAALRHFAERQGDKDFANKIRDYYLVNEHADSRCKTKLKVTENNERDLSRLLEENPDIPASPYSNINSNYKFFSERIDASNRETVYKGFQRLLFVEISLERGKDNAQEIFESLNSTGLALSQADLIRNYILMGLEPSAQERLYTQYWSEIESNTKDEGEARVSDFIRDYLTLKTEKIPTKKDVYNTFKEEFRPGKGDEAEKTLCDLRRYSGIYRRLLNPECIEDKDIKREISYIRHIEVNVSYPFLLQALEDYDTGKITRGVLINVLRFVQTYACRRFVSDLPTNALNKVFADLYKHIDEKDYEQSLYNNVLKRGGKVRMPSDAEIRERLPEKDLYNINDKMRRYILERLENFGNNENVEIIGNTKITVEHIFPQKPDPEWKAELSEDDYNLFEGKYIHTIGNLTLSGNNGALGNRTFREKKNMNKNNGEQGYAFSRLWLNRGLKEIDKWDISNYKKRTESLVARFLQIWQIPQMPETEDLDEININSIDSDSVSNKSIEYATFFGEKFTGDKGQISGIQLYNHILRKLLDLSSEEELIRKFGDILRLKKNRDEYHRMPLNSAYYYHTNLSSRQIFSNLKRILEELGLSDELHIKFREKK